MTLTAVQEKRTEARVYGREALAHGTTEQLSAYGVRAAKVLRGHVGFTPELQIARLSVAAGLYGKCAEIALSPAQKALYDQAQAACKAGVEVVASRDNAAYQAGKHQGSEGWVSHMQGQHADVLGSEGIKTMLDLIPEMTYLEDDEDKLAEAAYQLHKTLPSH